MRRDDALYGARSGIQKAVRRCDLDLGKTCFDLLWSEKEHRNWLKWRSAILVAEEAWFMAGELAKVASKKDMTEKSWRKFIYEVILVPKSKDSVGLWCLSTIHRKYRNKHMPKDLIQHPEMVLMDKVMADTKDPETGKGNVANAAEEAYEWAKKQDLSDYEQNAVRFLRNRSGWGGMMGDRYFCVSSILLIGMRGMPEEQVRAQVDIGLKAWTKRVGKVRKPKTVKLPWFIFDMHTQAGKIALSIFVKHKAKEFGVMNRGNADDWWFECESGIVLDAMTNYDVKDPSAPGMLDNIWFPWHLRAGRTVAPFRNAAEAMKAWRGGGQAAAKECVEWIMKKRAEGD